MVRKNLDKAGGMGLTRVSTGQLRALLRHVHRDEISCPITPAQLAPMGFQGESEVLMGSLRGLDVSATRALLTAVIAERMVFGDDERDDANAGG